MLLLLAHDCKLQAHLTSFRFDFVIPENYFPAHLSIPVGNNVHIYQERLFLAVQALHKLFLLCKFQQLHKGFHTCSLIS